MKVQGLKSLKLKPNGSGCWTRRFSELQGKREQNTLFLLHFVTSSTPVSMHVYAVGICYLIPEKSLTAVRAGHHLRSRFPMMPSTSIATKAMA